MEFSFEIGPEERLDDLQYGGLRLIQNPGLFCFSTDAVLLSAFAKIPRGSSVVDLGAGNGILEVLLWSRQPDAHYSAVEISSPLYDLLARNIALNGLAGQVRPVLADIRDAPRLLGSHNDVCVSNPPYEKRDSGRARTGRTQDAARREVLITFREICEAAAGCLRWAGRFYVVHRTERLAEILSTMRDFRLEPKMLQLCAGAPAKAPSTCLIMAQKGAREGMQVLPQLTMRNEDGTESKELRRIYRREEEK